MKKLLVVFALVFGLTFFASCGESEPTYYTVTFVQDGQEDIVKTIEGGKGLSQADIPTPAGRTGYTVTWEDVDLSNISVNIIVRAVYTANNYIITYNCPTYAPLHETTQTVTYNSSYTLAEPELVKHVQFKGWYFDLADETTKLESGSAWNIANNVTVYAKWQEDEKVTVTFRQEGYPDIVKTIYRGESLPASEIPTPMEVPGYEVSWNIPSFGNVREDLVVGIVRTPKTYIVTYDVDGVLEAYDEVTFGKVENLNYPINGKPNHTFMGWFTEDGVEVVSGAVWNIPSDTTLYANWKENEKVTVTFKQEGKDDIVKTIYKGEALSDIPTPVEVEGHTVVWETVDFSEINENMTVNAIITAETYNVKFDMNGIGQQIEDATVTYGEVYTLPTPTNDLYDFVKWTYNGTELAQSTTLEFDLGNHDDTITLVAEWTNKKVTITFVQEGQDNIVKTINKGATLEDIPTPVEVEGHTVVWETVDFSEINENMTVNAIITAETYNVKFDMNGIGQQIEDATVTYGEVYTLPTPTNDLYDFVKWTYNGTELAQSTTLEFDLGNHDDTITLVAEWTNKKVTITFVQEGQDNIVKTINKGATLEDIPTPVEVEGYDVSWSVTSFANVMANIEVTVVKTGKNYTVTYSLGEGESIDGELQETFKFGDSYTLKTPTKENYEFAGWINGEETFEISGTWNVAQNVVLTATWTKVAVTVTYNIGDTNFYGANTIAGFPEESEVSVAIGEEIVLPDLDIDYSADKEFSGWKVGDSDTILKGGATYTVEEDVVLTAIWYFCWTPNY